MNSTHFNISSFNSIVYCYRLHVSIGIPGYCSAIPDSYSFSPKCDHYFTASLNRPISMFSFTVHTKSLFSSRAYPSFYHSIIRSVRFHFHRLSRCSFQIIRYPEKWFRKQSHTQLQLLFHKRCFKNALLRCFFVGRFTLFFPFFDFMRNHTNAAPTQPMTTRTATILHNSQLALLSRNTGFRKN